MLFLVVGCSKNSISKEEFIDKASYNGYIVEENMSGYDKYDYAINRENAYDIQFLELISDDYAKKFFDVNKEETLKLKDNNSYLKTLNYSNYNLCHLETDSKYIIVIRSKNNVLYINASIIYINEIEDFLKELSLDY